MFAYVDLPVICTFKFCVGIVARQDILLPVLLGPKNGLGFSGSSK